MYFLFHVWLQYCPGGSANPCLILLSYMDNSKQQEHELHRGGMVSLSVMSWSASREMGQRIRRWSLCRLWITIRLEDQENTDDILKTILQSVSRYQNLRAFIRLLDGIPNNVHDLNLRTMSDLVAHNQPDTPFCATKWMIALCSTLPKTTTMKTIRQIAISSPGTDKGWWIFPRQKSIFCVFEVVRLPILPTLFQASKTHKSRTRCSMLRLGASLPWRVNVPIFHRCDKGSDAVVGLWVDRKGDMASPWSSKFQSPTPTKTLPAILQSDPDSPCHSSFLFEHLFLLSR